MLYFYTKVGMNNKGGRIWIEGETLNRAGFKPQKKFKVDYNPKGIEIKLSKEGERNVSKRTRSNMTYPIIDLNNSKILEIFDEDTPLMCSVEKGIIKISTHKIKELQMEREESLLSKIKKNKPLTESTLFCGGGISAHAISQGLKDKGIKTELEAIADESVSYLQVAERNLKPKKIYKGKVEDIHIEDITKSDILSFSMPCTGHSNQGKAKKGIKFAEEHDEASTAIFGVLNFVVNSNPSILISENVTQARNSATYILLRAELKRLGYEVFEYTLDNKQAGSIEARVRYWFVAISKGLLKKNKLEETIPTFKRKYSSIKSIITKRENEKWMPKTYFNARLEKNISNNRNFAPSFMENSDKSVRTIPRNYMKRQISNPHYYSKTEDKIRLFNPVEHAKLKGIPPKLIKDIADTTAHEILGQSILYNHARGIANMIGDFLNQLK